MITKLNAQNFKSWKVTGDLSLGRLTGLFGSNSSGKTSILQMLLMLKQTVESPDRKRVLHTGDEYSLVDLGTFYDLIYGHNSELRLGLSLSWDLPDELKIFDPETENQPLFTVKALTFNTFIREQSNRPVIERFEYRFNNKCFGMERIRDAVGKSKDHYELIHVGFSPKRVRGRVWPLPSPVKFYGFPDEAIGYYQNTGFLPDFALTLEMLFSTLSYLGPLRSYPQRNYIWPGESPPNVGRDGEDTIPALLASRSRGKTISFGKGKKRQTVEERIAAWLQKMGLIHSFSLKAIAANRKDYELRVKKTACSPEVLITDVGFGVSQILPVLVLCYYVPENSIILLEQPEIHLHPSVQADLADVLIDVVNTRSLQVIVESHSEHLLRRLQRRVAEEMISVDETALYFCSIQDGESRIQRLQVDTGGNILNWPQDFFGDELGDLTAMTNEAMRKATGVRQG